MLLNFHRHEHFLKDHSIGKCVGVFFFFVSLFFFLAHWFTLFLLCGCWPNQLKRMLKSIFHYTALSAYLWCVFMQNVAHLHIFLLWIVLTSQQATRTSFCCSENGSSSFMWSVYFSLSDPNLSLHFLFVSAAHQIVCSKMAFVDIWTQNIQRSQRVLIVPHL